MPSDLSPINPVGNVEMVLFPTDVEVRELFPESVKFDFVKLRCIQCLRHFSSVSGLELHMKDHHGINIHSTEDLIKTASPPSKVPLSPPELTQLRPAKSWASIAAKPTVTTSQPWSGRLIDLSSCDKPTPCRPVSHRPTRTSTVRGMNFSHPQNIAIPPSPKKTQKVSFKTRDEDLDEVSHIILMPAKPLTKRKKKFMCIFCDFSFETKKSREEHHVMHELEKEFNTLHGLVGNISSSNFDDFQLPKSPSRKPQVVSLKPRAEDPSLPGSSTSACQTHNPILRCQFCEKSGFQTRKALKYHLFRIHRQPMKKASQQMHPSQDQTAISPNHDASTHHDSSSPNLPKISVHPTSPINRQDARLSISFPIIGKLSCPEEGCAATFVSRSWTSMKGSVIKHLRFVHHFSIATCEFECGICHLKILCKPREHPCFAGDNNPIVIDVAQTLQCWFCSASFTSTLGLQNHVKSHKKAEAQAQLPALDIPPSRRRKRAKKARTSTPPASDDENQNITDTTQVLAQPIFDDSLTEDSPAPSDHEDEPLHHFKQIFDNILDCEPSDDSAELLSDTFSQIVAEVKNVVLPPSDRVSFLNSKALNIEDPQQCQKLYKRNRRRAIREIRGNTGERCMIPPPVIEEHFSNIWQEATSDHQFFSSEHQHRDEVLGNLLSVSEVSSAFRSWENTAPGPDRITYNHWRSLDPRALLLTKVFNYCIHLRRIPPSWKESTTILLPKNGDADCPSNWRPIALSNTAYKLFMKCLTARLQNWCTKYDILSPFQKGFTPFDGVMEHKIVLQRRIEKARAAKSNICLAFLDISNAFGSLPHSAIKDCLAAIGVGSNFLTYSWILIHIVPRAF
ncbi:retrovirus-related Pol polyprotein from type-1 retrotransposable element R2 [Caerostris darwini]|uniref:Retrovirus-related Pol polyprotein from type-1 retrotransposable element R2 n=1 Tax=Caerostris darwini TaxID=1538125 RepID=A0AAV4SJC7_9ARAC|nr:retrovirus-related Pol polyprotein from type-1 retrotransposable element R2 [Caerostris darwini]